MIHNNNNNNEPPQEYELVEKITTTTTSTNNQEDHDHVLSKEYYIPGRPLRILLLLLLRMPGPHSNCHCGYSRMKLN